MERGRESVYHLLCSLFPGSKYTWAVVGCEGDSYSKEAEEGITLFRNASSLVVLGVCGLFTPLEKFIIISERELKKRSIIDKF